MPPKKVSAPGSSSRPKEPLTKRLLRRAHSPGRAKAIYEEKFEQKPLVLHSTTPSKAKTQASQQTGATPAASVSKVQGQDARTTRRQARNAALEAKGLRRKRKPRPLSAREKRKLCIHEIPAHEKSYSLYLGLHTMWCEYIRGILGISEQLESGKRVVDVNVSAAVAGPRLVSADFHGAEIDVVRSKCVTRVGVRGIVLRDRKFVFEVITKGNEVKTIPKEGTVFAFEIPLEAGLEGQEMAREATSGTSIIQGEKDDKLKKLRFELYGEQFKNRAPERANKKFKIHLPPGL